MLTQKNPRELLAWVVSDLHAKGWAPGGSGQFSLVMSRTPLTLLMSPCNADRGMVRPSDLIVVDAQGKICDGRGKAPQETTLHHAIVSATGAGAVIHTHSLAGTLVSEMAVDDGELPVQGYEILGGLGDNPNGSRIEHIPVFRRSSSITETASVIKAHLEAHTEVHAFLLGGSGLYTWGKDVMEARRHAEILEFVFELMCRRRLLGISPA